MILILPAYHNLVVLHHDKPLFIGIRSSDCGLSFQILHNIVEMVHAALIGMGITSSESGIHFRYIVSSAAVKDININLPTETAFLHKCFNQGKQLLILEGDTLICLSCPA